MSYQLFELQNHQNFFSKLIGILQRWLIVTIISLFIVAIINGILLKFGISLEDHSRLADEVGSRTRLQVLMQVIIIGPIVEELMFRSWLTLKFYWVFLCGIVIGGILMKNSYMMIGLAVVLIGIIISGLIYFKKLRINNHHISYAIIVSSIVFGLVHINNFKSFHGREIFIVIPQLLLGFLLSKIRVSYGLHYSIFLHIFHNGMVGMGIVAAKYLKLWPLEESLINNTSGLVFFGAFCMIYYGSILGTIIISFFYQNDIIKSNNRQKEYQHVE